MLFLNYPLKKKLWKSEDDWQTLDYKQDFIEDWKACRKRAEKDRELSGFATKIRIFCGTLQNFSKNDWVYDV